ADRPGQAVEITHTVILWRDGRLSPWGERTGTARLWFVSQLLNDPSSRRTHATGQPRCPSVRHPRQGRGGPAPVLRRRETWPSPLPVWKRLPMKKKAGAGSADAGQRVR